MKAEKEKASNTQEKEDEKEVVGDNATTTQSITSSFTSSIPAKTAKTEKKKKREKSKKKIQRNPDPSQRYASHPLSAPLIVSAKSFFKSHALSPPFPIFMGSTTGWRTHSKLAVRGSKPLKIGLFAPGSHDVTVTESVAHHDVINFFTRGVTTICNELNIVGYDEATGEGDLKYVQISVETGSEKAQVTLVWNAESEGINKSKNILDSLTKRIINDKGGLSEKLHSLYVHFNKTSQHDNNIFGRGENSWVLVYGPKAIEETMDISSNENDVPLFFPPNVFRQANQRSFGGIIDSVRKFMMEAGGFKHALELYGGVGTIGLNLCDLGEKLVCSDENPYNVACFEKSRGRLGKKLRKKVEYVGKSAEQCVKDSKVLSKDVDVVVVDPPRKGLDDSVKKALSNSEKYPALKTLVYISCGFQAFVKDCGDLEKGGWKIEKAEGHVLFPGADAIETLAIFKR